MLRRVAPVRADVSEVPSDSIIRVKRNGNVTPAMEALSSSETFGSYKNHMA
jgi:hypothetical protein